MSPIPLLKHRNTVVTLADQNEFVTKYEATNDHLSNNTVVEVNAICNEIDVVASEINVIKSETNDIKNETNTIKSETNDIRYATAGYRNEALTYKTNSYHYSFDSSRHAEASEMSYQNTVSLIAETDIAGTAGYTISAIDSKNNQRDLENFLNFKF